MDLQLEKYKDDIIIIIFLCDNGIWSKLEHFKPWVIFEWKRQLIDVVA
jgi:hypothetical protein